MSSERTKPQLLDTLIGNSVLTLSVCWSSGFRLNGCRLDFAKNGAINRSEIAADGRMVDPYCEVL